MIIKILSAAALSVLIANNAHAMSSNQAYNVYTRVANANGIKFPPNFIISSDSSVNASSGGFRITVNQGMLNAVGNNNNKIALVLGHELAHYTLGHTNSTPKNEYQADAVGAKYMMRAGYNKCNGAQLLKTFGPASSTHPSGISRYKRLGC